MVEKRHFLIKRKFYISKDKTQAFLKISNKSKFKDYDELEDDLIKFCNKEKAKKKILVGIFDERMKQDISLMVQEIKKQKFIKKDRLINLSVCDNYVASVEPNVSFDYLPKNINKKDLANCFCYVENNQNLISYSKGVQGENGIDIFGFFQEAKKIIIKNDITFSISSDIATINNSHGANLVAKKKGIVCYINNTFTIQEKISFNSLEFKKIRYFDVPLEIEDITIDIKSNREFENAINNGVYLKAHNINISGDVDSNVTIIAVNLTIDGNIHHNSILRAENAKLKILKGKLKSNIAQIQMIENGLVIANKVNIDKIIGGEIRAKDIEIESLHSNNKINCSNSLIVNSISGNDNNITMTMLADMEFKKEITILKKKISKMKEIDEALLMSYKNKYKTYALKVTNANKKIIEENKKGFDTVAIQRAKELDMNILNNLKKDIEIGNNKKKLEDRLKEIDKFLYQTNITLKNPNNGDNMLIYDYVHKKDDMRTKILSSFRKIAFTTKDNQDKILF